MELYTAGLLGTIGYLLSKNQDNSKTVSNFKDKEHNISRNEKPSVDSVYSGKHFNKTIEDTI